MIAETDELQGWTRSRSSSIPAVLLIRTNSGGHTGGRITAILKFLLICTNPGSHRGPFITATEQICSVQTKYYGEI